MASNHYLEFDSSYRDRNQYPLPASFVAQISQSGQKSRFSALDPVCESEPILTWVNSFVENTPANEITGITVAPAGPPSEIGNIIFQINSGESELRQVTNFYVGCSIYFDTGTNFIPRRIVDYQYLNTTNAIITLDSAMPDANIGTGGAKISNPTPLPTNTASSVIKFYIPTGVLSDNFYLNYYVENMSTGESRLIIGYDGATRLATLASATSTDWSANTSAQDYFVIRSALPINVGTIVAVGSNNTSIQLQSTASTISESYDGNFLRIAPGTASAPYSTTVAPNNSSVRIVKYIAGSGKIVSLASTSVTLDNTASNQDGYYVGGIITDTTASVSGLVLQYTGSTRTAIVNTSLGGIGHNWYMATAILASSFPATPTVGSTYEVEQFTRDNSVPFSYNGSLVSSQEEVCYEVELLNLILPNTTLASGRGGRPIFYPYLYVKLQQISGASARNRNTIYSNNPNSVTMLFRAVVDDTPIPVISPFIKIDGDGMVHTIKFKPNDSFLFEVRHTNGDLFQTVVKDFYSPSEPNPLAQISACFAFKRV